MTIDQHAFRAVLGRFASGVTIVTVTDSEGADRGMTVSAFCSVSLEPPLVLICVDHDASIYEAIRDAEGFTVNILSDGQEALARRFAETDPDRFEGIGFARGGNGQRFWKRTARIRQGPGEILSCSPRCEMDAAGR